MNKNIIILGGGMVGFAIARDLKGKGYFVTVADIDESLQNNLIKFNINYEMVNFTDKKKLFEIVKKYDFVIGAVPGFLGYEILKVIIESKKDMVDISFMKEDSRDYYDYAKSKGVTIVTDAGVAPGLSNLFFGQIFHEFDKLNVAKCYVGGLPEEPKPPWFYKTVFSPIDVIEEYTRPARYVENNKVITKDAMTGLETVYIENIGELDAFNSDGLRSLLNFPIPNMIEKTLRYPGHIQKILSMKAKGMFNSDKIHNTANSLISEWKSDLHDYDQTIMKLEFEGLKNNKNRIEEYILLDNYDRVNKISSMARTTGYTCTAVANLILSNKFNKKGVYTLENLGENKEDVLFIIKYLLDRDIRIDKNIN